MADRCPVATINYSEGSNEVTLYKDNQPILKAEHGVTLGLLKLIYSTDDTYSGILLGVKPRLSNQELPRLLTFDSTSLTHAEYDLIVQAAANPECTQSEAFTQQASSVTQRPVSYEGNVTACDRSLARNPRRQTTNIQSISSSFQTQGHESSNEPDKSLGSSSGDLRGEMGHDLLLSPSSTNLLSSPGAEPFNHGCHLPSQQEQISSGSFSNVDCEQVHDPPDSTVQESDISGFVLNAGTRLCDTPDDVDESHNSLGPDCKDSVEVHFNPEEFNFNIASVVPFQSDKGNRWPCDRCGKDFCSSSHLKRHWILHTDFKPYKCKVCSKCFPFQWDLKKHMTSHTGEKRFKCPLCPKSFNTHKELGNHNWLHTGKKEYQCHVCHHEFTSLGNLKIHMRKHTGEKPYKCEYCPKSFHMMGHYQYHVRHHTGEKPYQCNTCGKAFSYSHNLNEHKNVHTGYRPYSCSQCEKKFTHRSTFKQHLLMHLGSKPYKCHVCSKSFVQSSNYRRHILTHKNKEERVQKCDLCNKELLSSRGFQKHRLRCAKMTVERANTNVPIPKNTRLKRGQYHCQYCPRIFAYNRRLEVHIMKKHSPSTKDTVVKTIKPSVKANAPEGPSTSRNEPRRVLGVQCSICGRRFGYTKRLREHQAKVHHRAAVQGSASSTVPEIGTCNMNTSGKYVFIIPKPGDGDNGLPLLPAVNHLTGSPAMTVPRETPSNSQSASSQTANRFLQPDDKEKQDARETGFEALSALGRLSAKIGMEESLFNQSVEAPGMPL